MESELYLRHVLEEKGFMIGCEMDEAPRKGRLIRSNRTEYATIRTQLGREHPNTQLCPPKVLTEGLFFSRGAFKNQPANKSVAQVNNL
nr:hypothetical protein CFP56_61301 [Quercus suber]